MHTHEPFDPDRSRLTRTMADGHLIRCGHELVGYWTNDEFPSLVRTCCTERAL